MGRLDCLADLGRAASLALAAGALCVLIVWTLSPTKVDTFGQWIVDSYEKVYSARLRTAEKTLQKDRDQGVKAVETLLRDLHRIKKRDRLDPIKRRSLELVTEALSKEHSQLERAIYWADQWVDFDEKDLNGHVRRVELLGRAARRQTEARDTSSRLYGMVPETEAVVQLYAETMIEQGKIADAFNAVSDYAEHYLNAVVPSFWQLFWDSGDGFNETQSKKVEWILDGHGKLTLSVNLTAPVRQLRVDPPPFSRLMILEPKMVTKVDGKETTMQLWNISLGVHQMTQADRALETTGEGDPFFYWELPMSQHGAGLTIVVEAKVSRLPPTWVARFVARPEIQTLIDTLPITEEKKATSWLRELITQSRGSRFRDAFY